MLALRGIGMICVFGAAILTGRELELRLKRRWIVLSEIAGGLTLLEKDMLCHRSSLAEALQTVAKRCRSEAGQLFAAAGIRISMTGTGPFSAIWSAISQRKRAWQTSYRDGIRGASRACHRVVQRRSGSTACTISAIRGAVSGYEPGRTGTISGEGSTVPEACSCRRGFSCAASDLSRKDRYECKPDF